MQLQQPAPLYTSSAPWQEREISYGMKILLIFACALLLIIAIVTFVVCLLVLPAVFGGTRASTTSAPSVLAMLITVVLFVGSVIGLIFLLPRSRATTRWVPKTPIIPPLMFGQPFEVKFRRKTFRRSFRGKGLLRFDGEGWTMQGYLEPHILFQLMIVLVVTFIPLILFRFGLGLIPALILAYYIGRKKITRPMHYSDVQDLKVRGCEVSFRCAGPAPNQVTLDVSSLDGERLYRELFARFPTALGGWVAR